MDLQPHQSVVCLVIGWLRKKTLGYVLPTMKMWRAADSYSPFLGQP